MRRRSGGPIAAFEMRGSVRHLIGHQGAVGHAKGGEAEASAHDGLTARAREVLQLLAEGKSNKEVASILGISTRTAQTHRAEIMHKLKLNSLSDLVRYAIRNGLIRP